jgi:metal transporter CNNM
VVNGVALDGPAGLLSLDNFDIEVLRRSGSPLEKKHAARIAPVLAHQHWLLVTLLVCNAAALEALPIVLDELVPTYACAHCATASASS